MTKQNIKKLIIIGLIFIALGLSTYGIYFYYKQQKEPEKQEIQNSQATTSVKVEPIKEQTATTSDEYITTTGQVKPKTEVKITSSNRGTIVKLPFSAGDKVFKNQTLAYLENENTQINYKNAQTNYKNMLNQLESVKESAQENVNKAETGVEKARTSVESAKLQLKQTKNNYQNTLETQEQNLEDTKENIITSLDSYLKLVENSLDDIDYLLDIEEGPHLESISKVLAAKDQRQLTQTKHIYKNNKEKYLEVKDIEFTHNNLGYFIEDMIELLEETKQTTNKTLTVLDNTVTSRYFPQSALDQQKTKFNEIYSNLISNLQQIKKQRNNLNSLELKHKNKRESLQDKIDTAKNQVESAKTSYQQAQTSLEVAKKNKQQQILSTQTSVDKSQGQLNLTKEKLKDLTIDSNIKGTILNQPVEAGDEIKPGTVVATVGKINNLKVEINLDSQDVYSIETGQTVLINDNIKGKISSINPSANSKTKKVTVDIIVDNPKNLITGTFVEVKIKTNSSKNSNKIFAPLDAVTMGQNENFVFIATSTSETNYKAQKQTVSTGELKSTRVEITQGLDTGDKLITENHSLLDDGEKIEIED